MTSTSTAAVLDGVARLMSDAIDGSHIFAAGVTTSVTDAAPLVVPVSEDFTLTGGEAAVLVTLGTWTSKLMTYERLTMVVKCEVWRELGADLGQVANLLLADRDAVSDAFIAHTKAYGAETTLQSVTIEGGPGLVPRTIGEAPNARTFLTLPFTANAVLNRPVNPQPS